ncbi:MAG: diaminopimelate decarboxylase [Oscillospiraceae bacterium]|nr:diaminopimelate decarboxylase [Oscillospiraceae bacterium]
MDNKRSCLGVNDQNRLTIGGADVAELAKAFGTPCYIMDENKIRSNLREFACSLKRHYPEKSRIAYASKAFSCAHIYSICDQEGVCADVASGGELYTAMKGRFPANNIYFHGNNKTSTELRYAINLGVRCIVADHADEIRQISAIGKELGKTLNIGLRLKPGVEAHTHEFIQTGKTDSKFGADIASGEALALVKEILEAENVKLTTVHCHIGSQIFEAEPFGLAAMIMMKFMAQVKEELGYKIPELNLGGGFGIYYSGDDSPKEIADITKAISHFVIKAGNELHMPLPELVLEPGRSIVGPAGITVYKIGAVKNIPGGKTYLSVDGGMGDNIRHALYGATYEATLLEGASNERTEIVSIAGRYCESGDFICRDILLQPAKAGDLLAVLDTGAYNYSMASHYNRVPKPPVVMVSNGNPFVVVRKESWEDVAKFDNVIATRGRS